MDGSQLAFALAKMSSVNGPESCVHRRSHGGNAVLLLFVEGAYLGAVHFQHFDSKCTELVCFGGYCVTPSHGVDWEACIAFVSDCLKLLQIL